MHRFNKQLTKKEYKILDAVYALGINPDTISFYENLEGESPDLEFGTCDITGIEGMLVDCTAQTIPDEDTNEVTTIEFQALESLVGAELGFIAGAF